MPVGSKGVLLVDWDNLSSAVIKRGHLAERGIVDALWRDATTRCGGHLHYKHMAAVRFDGTISTAMAEHLIDADVVVSLKEQADIHLTVLAMDYLHQGCGHFVLVTGDQDFIPLIRRLLRDGCQVTVVYGDPDRLSPQFRGILTLPGLDSLCIDDIYALRKLPPSTCRDVIGLLELQRRGFILGGRETGERTALLAGWRILDNEDESRYWALVESVGRKVTRTDAAARDRSGFSPRSMTRTYLDIDPERFTDLVAVDFVLRRLAARAKGYTLAQLRTGPLQTDDGPRLHRVLDALTGVGLVRKGADDTYAVTTEDLALGYLEPLWRVHAALAVECYRRQRRTIPYRNLTGLLNASGVGQGPDRRAAGRINQVVRYAAAAGVVDAVAVDGERHAIAVDSPLTRTIETAYHELYREFADRAPSPVPESQVLEFMTVRDRTRAEPVFGYDSRDRHRILRVLAQSRALTWRDEKVTVPRTRWGDSGSSSA
ncbi:NYN domain-containing protein [Micromonospora sp. WMMD980]|uniref:NYN domain-containing protein n=1 Tax=Micromonospora sp. WMMD980 TaxID=3016088 RepID=UPI002416D5D9|nr:NYN domain-containing protein [Micromonospora sp. WMMD980]MDG4802663.1 NYN domain-containing protein [Micromonospora sp. WMMD980]